MENKEKIIPVTKEEFQPVYYNYLYGLALIVLLAFLMAMKISHGLVHISDLGLVAGVITVGVFCTYVSSLIIKSYYESHTEEITYDWSFLESVKNVYSKVRIPNVLVASVINMICFIISEIVLKYILVIGMMIKAPAGVKEYSFGMLAQDIGVIIVALFVLLHLVNMSLVLLISESVSPVENIKKAFKVMYKDFKLYFQLAGSYLLYNSFICGCVIFAFVKGEDGLTSLMLGSIPIFIFGLISILFVNPYYWYMRIKQIYFSTTDTEEKQESPTDEIIV